MPTLHYMHCTLCSLALYLSLSLSQHSTPAPYPSEPTIIRQHIHWDGAIGHDSGLWALGTSRIAHGKGNVTFLRLYRVGFKKGIPLDRGLYSLWQAPRAVIGRGFRV